MVQGDCPRARARSLAGCHLLFLASGVPGLVSQLAWTRIFSAGLGHEFPSLLGVVSAFFAGLAAGAWFLDGPITRSARPLRWYAGLELVSAAWVALGIPFLGAANAFALQSIGTTPSAGWYGLVAFLVPLIVVGPAAMAMGATLPAMERAVTALAPGRRAVAGLYALNTAGAMLGVIAAVGWLMPWLGFRGTLWLAAATQAACGILGWLLAQSIPGDSSDPPERVEFEANRVNTRLLITALAAGLLGMGYELLGVRALAQTTENTVRTFAAALAVFLAGTALGAGVERWAARRQREPTLETLAGLLGSVLLLELWVIARSEALQDFFLPRAGGFGAEVLLATMVFGVPTMLMGALFSRIAQSATSGRTGVGRALAANTLGGAMAAPLFVHGLLPHWGLAGTLAAVGCGYLAMMPPPWRKARRLAWTVAIAGLVLIAPRLQFIRLPAGATVPYLDEGLLATVAVVRTTDGHRTLRVNNHFQQGGTATANAAQRHAQLPLLLHPNPRRALFLGVGTGITLGAAAAHPDLHADGVELLEGVVRALPYFEPENGAPGRNPRFRLIQADARRFIRTTTERYDVVVADLFHPAEDGAGFLYTREHFAAMRDRLAPGGVVCQWLPLHQLELGTFRDIARTFLEAFPDASLWLLRFNLDAPVVGLVATTGGDAIAVDSLRQRMDEPRLAAALRPLALSDPVRLLGCRLADTGSLRRIAATGEIATDDRPVVLFGAASTAYSQIVPPHHRLLALLAEADPWFAALPVRGTDPGALVRRLEAFRVSRDRHLGGLAKEIDGRRREALDDYVSSAAASADYTAGYAQGVLVASAFAREDPRLARNILERLIAARPEQRLAVEVLGRIEK